MGKISKSKKTLALVMALVMVFTIVPFGAWGVIKASAATSEPPANARFKKVTELKDGQAYLVICQDSKHVLAEKWGPRGNYTKPNRIDAWDFDPTASYDTETLRHVLWEYDVVDNSSRATLSHVSPDTGIDPGKRLYVDVLDAYNDSSDRTITLNPNSANCSNYVTPKANGDGEFHVSYPGKAYLHSECNDDGIHGNFDAQSGETPVLFYELITDAPETMEIPVSFRDLNQDKVTVQPEGVSGGFSEGFGFLQDDTETKVSNGAGHIYTTFLRLAGGGPNADGNTTYDYREGLTQEKLNADGKLKYSPYTVIYLAHALREAMWIPGVYGDSGDRYYCNVELQGSPLADALRDKFAKNTGNRYHALGVHTEPMYKGKFADYGDARWHQNATAIEPGLLLGNIKGLCSRLDGSNNAARKAQVDAFFANCASYDSAAADNAMNAISGLTAEDKLILKDYWLTVSHADSLTYERITNENPCFDPTTVYYEWDRHWSSGWVWDWPELKYDFGGASYMDVAYYLLNHYFDSDNAEQYAKPVNNAAQELQLKRIIKADGTTTYVYDSAFASEWGHDDKIINNTKLDYTVYTGASGSVANFTPINGLGFAEDNDPANDNNTNYGLSMHGNGKFVYSQGENLYFDFIGDDDVFLYINNKKTKVDIGGIHGPQGTRIYLNDIAATHDLKEGEIYDFDFFYMERCPDGSNLRMETNIRVLSANLIPQKSAYQSVDCELADYIPTGAGVPMGTTIYYEFGATNRGADFGEANVDLENIKFIDSKLGIEISKDNVNLGTRNHDDIAAQSMGAIYQTWNGTEWVDDAAKSKETFTGVEDIKMYMTNLKLPKDARVFIYGIPHTLNENDKLDGDIYNNNLKVVSGVEGVAGREKLGYASSGVEVLDVNTDKTVVVDYAGNLKYTPEMLYNSDEMSRNVAGNSRTTVSYSKGGGTSNFGTTTVSADGTLTFNMNGKTLTGTELVTIDEKIEYPNIKMPVGAVDGAGHQIDHYTTTVSKTVRFVPANNVYYDDSFTGIEYGAGWSTQTGSGAALTGQGGTKLVYGNAGKEVQFTDEVHYIQGGNQYYKPVSKLEEGHQYIVVSRNGGKAVKDSGNKNAQVNTFGWTPFTEYTGDEAASLTWTCIALENGNYQFSHNYNGRTSYLDLSLGGAVIGFEAPSTQFKIENRGGNYFSLFRDIELTDYANYLIFDSAANKWTTSKTYNTDCDVMFYEKLDAPTASAPVTAEFKFNGTGYSLYMNTNSASGNVIALVYEVNEDGTIGTKPVAMDSVIVKSAGEYKGVPVINRQGLAKGNYVVKLSVAIKGEAVAYLNGIRVYGADIEGIEYDATETNARFIEIRDNLLNGKLDAGSYGTGILYIDGSDGEANVAEYVAEGPKNEIYLKQNQGIAFKLSGALNDNQKIHVSARTLDGAATTMQAGAGEKATDIAVNSTVDMYFDVTATATDNVYVIKNTGAGTLALTNLKITNSEVGFDDMAQATAEQAIALFSMAAPVEPEVPETPTEPETPVVPQNPFEKFWQDVQNFFNKLFGIK